VLDELVIITYIGLVPVGTEAIQVKFEEKTSFIAGDPPV